MLVCCQLLGSLSAHTCTAMAVSHWSQARRRLLRCATPPCVFVVYKATHTHMRLHPPAGDAAQAAWLRCGKPPAVFVVLKAAHTHTCLHAVLYLHMGLAGDAGLLAHGWCRCPYQRGIHV